MALSRTQPAVCETEAREISAALQAKLARLRLLAMDVDGVLTDGAVIYDSQGSEQKRFHVADGLGIVLLRLMEVEVAWITGRESVVTSRRARELGISHVRQNTRDKRAALLALSRATDVALEEIGYIGDDWNDLPAFGVAGVCFAVANAVRETREAADYLTTLRGGQGAVREVCDLILEAKGVRDVCRERYFQSLREETDGLAGQ